MPKTLASSNVREQLGISKDPTISEYEFFDLLLKTSKRSCRLAHLDFISQQFTKPDLLLSNIRAVRSAMEIAENMILKASK